MQDNKNPLKLPIEDARLNTARHNIDAMKFDRLEYIIAESPELPDILVVEADGRAHYESHSNESTPVHPEIGIYETNLTGSEIQSLEGTLNTPLFEAIPDHWGHVRSGERFRRIRVTTGLEKKEKLVGFRAPIDPAMRRIMDALDQIVLKVRLHPYQTVLAKIEQIIIGNDKVLTAVLMLSNTGPESVRCRNPVDLNEGTYGQLLFQAWSDKPRADLRPEDLIIANPLSPEDLRPGENALPFIEIGPGAKFSFCVRFSLGLQRTGRYLIRAFFSNSTAEMGGKSALTGELFSQTVAIDLP